MEAGGRSPGRPRGRRPGASRARIAAVRTGIFDRADRALVAESMGFASWTAFAAVLDAHRERVSQQFEQVFSIQETPLHALASLWQDGQDDLVGAGTGAEKRL